MAYSKADFYAKMGIALKEASETQFWLEFLAEADFLKYEDVTCAHEMCNEIIRILVSILKKNDKNTPDT